jgi:hypothetical protein
MEEGITKNKHEQSNTKHLIQLPRGVKKRKKTRDEKTYRFEQVML